MAAATALTTARLALQNPSSRPLSSDLGLFRRTQDNDAQSVWSAALTGMLTASPKWQAARQDLADRDERKYWVDPAEGMAFAFSAQLVAQGSQITASRQQLWINTRVYPGYVPQGAEVVQQAPVFQTLFAHLEPLHLAGVSDPTATPPSLRGAVTAYRVKKSQPDAAAPVSPQVQAPSP